MSFSVISSKEHRVSYSEFFGAYQYMYLICDWLELQGIYHGLGPCQKNFQKWENLDWFEMISQSSFKSLYKPYFKKFRLTILVPKPMQQYKNMSEYDTDTSK